MTILLAALLGLTSLTTGAGIAAAAPNCGGWGGVRIVSASAIKNLTTGVKVGSVQLCEGYNDVTREYYYLTGVYIGYTMNPYPESANGVLKQFKDHTSLGTPNRVETCQRPIHSPDRLCNTVGLYPQQAEWYRGEAFIFNRNGVVIAAGATGYYCSNECP